MKQNKSDTRAGQFLGPLIKHVAFKPGAVAAVAKLLSKRTGQPQFRANVAQWLDPDSEKRVQPRLGIGLILGDIWQDVQAEKVEL